MCTIFIQVAFLSCVKNHDFWSEFPSENYSNRYCGHVISKRVLKIYKNKYFSKKKLQILSQKPLLFHLNGPIYSTFKPAPIQKKILRCSKSE